MEDGNVVCYRVRKKNGSDEEKNNSVSNAHNSGAYLGSKNQGSGKNVLVC